MKQLILIFFLSISQLMLFGQGNLQFNSVINTTVSGTLDAIPDNDGTLLGTLFIPAGQVFKLESAGLYTADSGGQIETGHTQYGGGAITFDYWAMIGSHMVWTPFILTTTGSYKYSPIQVNKFPIWYGPGSHEIRVRRNANTTSSHIVYYSGIVFNVLP